MLEKLPPQKFILLAIAAFLFIFFAEVWLLSSQPWLGVKLKHTLPDQLSVAEIYSAEMAGKLAPGDRLLAIASNNHERVLIEGIHAVEDPDNYPVFAMYNQAYVENAAVYQRLLDEGTLLSIQGKADVKLESIGTYPLSHFPANFWIMNLGGLIGLLFGVGIWAYRPKELVTGLLAVGGVFLMLANTAIAVYGSKELAIDPQWYRFLSLLNHFAMPIFTYALVNIVLVYPYPLISKKVVALFFFIPLLSWINEFWQIIDLPFHTFYFVMVLAYFINLPAIYFQWQRTRKDPVNRAVLKLMLLSIYGATGWVVLLYLLPPFFGEKPVLPIWAVMLIFLWLYLGFIFGVLKYRLFYVDGWWLKSWLWVLTGFMIVFVDVLLAWLLNTSKLVSLTLAVILVAWVYFPLRQWFWRRFIQPEKKQMEEYLVQVAALFNADVELKQVQYHWQQLLQEIYEPASISQVAMPCLRSEIADNGLVLRVPIIENGSESGVCFELSGKLRGSKLFANKDRELVENLRALINKLVEIRKSQQQAAQQERERIMRDLHDDVGANLLSMIYRAKSSEDKALAQETLKLLREAIYTLDQKGNVSLAFALHEWKREFENRLQGQNIHLVWEMDLSRAGNQQLSKRQYINISRILREALSNALNHARPDFIEVNDQYSADTLIITIEHDGYILPVSEWLEGKGLGSMRTRASELNGEVLWENKPISTGQDGLRVIISIPLHKEVNKGGDIQSA